VVDTSFPISAEMLDAGEIEVRIGQQLGRSERDTAGAVYQAMKSVPVAVGRPLSIHPRIREEIRAKLAAGVSAYRVRLDYGVGKSTIAYIKKTLKDQ